MSLEELEAEIKKLDLKDRATLAKWVVESLDDLSEAEMKHCGLKRLSAALMNWSRGWRPRYC